MRRLFSIGEALIDFIPNITNTNLKDVQTFTKQIDGAPCNVVCTVQKLGQQVHMVTQLDNGTFGDSIIETILSIGIDILKMYRADKANTALAFVSLTGTRERDFPFYRKPSADMLFEPGFVNDIDVNGNDVVYFCSVDLVDSPTRGAHYQLTAETLNANGTVVFGPNVRLPLRDNAEDLRQTIHTFLPLAHIVKASDEELEFITGIHDENETIQPLFTGNITVVIYTKGADDTTVYLGNDINHYHSGYKVEPVNTAGTGDTSIGTVINKVLTTGVSNLTQLFENEDEEILASNSRVAAIVTTKYGAINSLPTLQEVEQAF